MLFPRCGNQLHAACVRHCCRIRPLCSLLCDCQSDLQVTIKAADASINKDVRKALVAGFSKAVQAVGKLPGERLYMTFEDIPVQNFAVGDSIMTFDTMHT